ncbi:NUDIX hydrolase, partial [Patescibacteria group bacterium AH-259-L07]|nr:NUDIX hydrolase [Patescibacteria group bacterium AH-259-L07]
MPIEKWKKVEEKRVFDNFAKIDIATFKLPNGELKDFDIKTTDHDVISVFGLTSDKKVILTKQFRPGPEKIFYEFCAGLIEKGEEPVAAAKREFLEETGCTGEFQDTGVIEYVSAYNKAATYCFVALNCHKVTD